MAQTQRIASGRRRPRTNDPAKGGNVEHNTGPVDHFQGGPADDVNQRVILSGADDDHFYGTGKDPSGKFLTEPVGGDHAPDVQPSPGKAPQRMLASRTGNSDPYPGFGKGGR